MPAARLRRGAPRSVSFSAYRTAHRDLRAGAEEYPDEGQHADRPRTRAECPDTSEGPCPWVSCKYHLYLDVNERTGSLKVNFPGVEVWELPVSCALDVADAEGDGVTLDAVAHAMNLTRERVRQIEVRALASARALCTQHADPYDVTARESTVRPVDEPEVLAATAERALCLAGWVRIPPHGSTGETWRDPQGRGHARSSALAVGRIMCRDEPGETRQGAYLGRGARAAAGRPPVTETDRERVLSLVRTTDRILRDIAGEVGVSESLAWRWARSAGIDLHARAMRRRVVAGGAL